MRPNVLRSPATPIASWVVAPLDGELTALCVMRSKVHLFHKVVNTEKIMIDVKAGTRAVVPIAVVPIAVVPIAVVLIAVVPRSP